AHQKSDQSRVCLCAGGLRKRAAAYYFSIDTSVALIIAKTLSPTLRFIRLTEPVVMIAVTSWEAVRSVSSDTTLSETIVLIVPGIRFRMLVLMLSDSITAHRENGRAIVRPLVSLCHCRAKSKRVRIPRSAA